MSINKVRMAVCWPGIVAGVFFVLLSLGSAVAADYSVADQHRGEELYDGPLLGVGNVDGRWELYFGRPKPGLLATNFTMNYCGKELAPTIANLMTMIGKPCRSWSKAVEDRMMVYHRLEFQCR